jgi:cytochrome o ubiquinol oxidase subunit 3
MLGMTFLLGAAFLAMELFEFTKLAQEGYGWTTSAFLSAFFGLVGTHGLHIAVGLIWLSGLMIMLYKKGLTNTLHKRLALFSLYWHFLDIIWIFIFTLVYLMGVIA